MEIAGTDNGKNVNEMNGSVAVVLVIGFNAKMSGIAEDEFFF